MRRRESKNQSFSPRVKKKNFDPNALFEVARWLLQTLALEEKTTLPVFFKVGTIARRSRKIAKIQEKENAPGMRKILMELSKIGVVHFDGGTTFNLLRLPTPEDERTLLKNLRLEFERSEYTNSSIASIAKKKNFLSSEDEELINLVVEEILPEGIKTFPDDFIDMNKVKLREVEVPGTELHINPFSKTLVSSPKGYFRYQAKNPPEAKYIIYANKKGQKKIKIPTDNLSIFKAVTSYEKYVNDTLKKCFELFLDFTYDEAKAEFLTNIVKEKLGLKEKI